MNLATHQLRINVKSLAAEARFIRQELLRVRNSRIAKKGEVFNALHSHRVLKLRPEARIAYLALGFVRGRKYRQVEPNAKTEPDLAMLCRKINRFTSVSTSNVLDWLKS